jgi:HEAT repeat protein
MAAAVLVVGPAWAGGLDDALRRLASDDVLLADAAVEEIVAYGAPAVDSLLARLDDPARDVRAGAIRGLGLLGDPKASPALRMRLSASLERPPPETMESRYLRILLIQASGRLADREASDLLRRAGTSADPFERAHAAVSLMAMAEDPGYDLARECLADGDPAIRGIVAEGLGRVTGERSRDLLLEAVGDEAWVVRDAAYRSLASFRDDAGVREALRRGATDPSWYVRQTVAEAAAGGRPKAGGGRETDDPPRGE